MNRLKFGGSMKRLFGLKKVKTMKHGMCNNPKTMKKKKFKEWHDQLKGTSSKKSISSHIFFQESLSTEELVHLLFASHVQIEH